MKNHSKEPSYRVAEQLMLPTEVLGVSQIEITGSSQILLCGHKGIRLYSQTEIIVDLKDSAVCVQGAGLGIVSMTRNELLICGRLDNVGFIR